MSRGFHISDILTITTGRLVSTRHMDGIYDILNYMTGDNLFTHQLPRAAAECQPWLEEQLPFLRDIVAPDFESGDKEEVMAWVEEIAEHYGEVLLVEPLPVGKHRFIDPIEEAESLVERERIIVLIAPSKVETPNPGKEERDS